MEELTGVRAGKRSFYPAYVTSIERLERVIHALDRISRALVRTVEGQESLVRSTVRAAADHLTAEYVLFAVADHALPEAEPRYTVVGPGGRLLSTEDPLPGFLRSCLKEMTDGTLRFDVVETEQPGHHLRVPVRLDSEIVGGLLVWTDRKRTIDATDEAVLRILASQSVVALHNTSLHRRGERVQQALLVARQREVIDGERHRIARELHDSVTQSVLSAGMQIELCRTDAESPELAERLGIAKNLTRGAVDQLRSVIHALNHEAGGEHSSLPELLEQLTSVHLPADLAVELRIGGQPVGLPATAEHALFRICGEALFNSAVHGHARRAMIALSYRADRVTLSVSDDGSGEPEVLRRVLRVAGGQDLDGAHRGLANMQARARELGGTLGVRRSRIGGVKIQATLPIGAGPAGTTPGAAHA
ncbi:sensor histidine kinase [Amycolatopsis antarctica]|uniref:Sensor histidine kinase n=1 Tax=Amycolatopsis antarctica TaxID=1854586 RepID=A0A263CZV8_9PSEU|nr:sensor histidine kinase [Amycolatopsis antarctica]